MSEQVPGGACEMFSRANKANETSDTRFTQMLKDIKEAADEGEYGITFTDAHCSQYLAQKLRSHPYNYKVTYKEGYCGGGYKDDDEYHVTWKNGCKANQANTNNGNCIIC